jgi:NDP-sugar pyrophosphorylase family protein
MKAVLLAAGFGNRLEPLTNSVPKPMITLCGKPIIKYLVDDLVKLGFTEICIVVGYLSEQIINYFNSQPHNATLTFVIQKQIQGTADALSQAKIFVGNDSFLLYLSDTFIPENFEKTMSKMISDDSDICILSSPVPDSKISSTGTIFLDNDTVLKILEKQEHSSSNIAWAGIAFFHDNTIFKKIQEQNILKNLEITEMFNHIIQNGKKIKNYLCSEFIDAGTPEGLFKVSKFILMKNFSSISNSSHSKLHGPIFISDSCHVGNNCEIGPFVTIEENCTLGDNLQISNCIIFPESQISSNGVIRNHIISKEGKLSIANS